jgi:sugar lactone lactonase YvrE
VLQKTAFTLADPSLVLTYGGVEMRNKDGKPFLSNVNGIALTHDFSYFYFKPINQTHLYRIETKYLADESRSEKELASKVEDMGNVGVTHGLIADKKGNIYLTTSLDYSIKYLSPDGKLHTLVQDSRLLWPDSFGIGTDGFLYFSCAQLPQDPAWSNGKDRTELPYRVFKVKLP